MNYKEARSIGKDASHPHWVDAMLLIAENAPQRYPKKETPTKGQLYRSVGGQRALVLDVWGGKVWFLLNGGVEISQPIGQFTQNYRLIK